MTRQAQLLKESLAAIERLEARLHASEDARHQPLAIVGAGCRFPGGIENLEQLWRVVRDGRDAVSEVPRDRWDADAYYDPDPKASGKMVTKRGGFLSQVDRFEPQLFGISPREAATMDPQQRLLLETAWEALEASATAPDRLAGSSTGVFVGITTSDYGQIIRQGGPENSDVYSATGSALNAAAGRLSFTFGFQGPCVAVDTACSSSLVAVHLACQSLRAGESDLALAGGVNVVLLPDAQVLFSKWGMMAPDGACKTFDALADGFVRAEGCALIAIKRLADALAAGDPILAVVRGSAVNSDGRSSGLTVPNGPAQRAVLKKALASAKLAPDDIDYVEAHGTGTSLGDPIEIEALGAVMQGRSADRPLLIGSIKTNLGHTEAASGLAGLLKVVASLNYDAIPPHLHFSTPNPGIPWARLPVSVPTTLTPWPRGIRPRRAGVSSFGFSGTNAHVILEEAPVRTEAPNRAPGPTLVPLSARTEPALRELSRRIAERIRADPSISIADVALTAGTGRAHLPRRLALITDSAQSLARDLEAFANGASPGLAVEGSLRPGERQKVAFLYTGQGAQYAGMGKGLYDSEPVFRAAIDRADAFLAPRLGRSLIELLFPTDVGGTTLNETAYTQPALFALEYAVTELWRSWGITPAAVLGHSVGEYVAATVAGVMSFEDGLGLIAERGRLMQALPSGGEMAALFEPEAAVSARIARYADKVAIAAFNGPEEIVISGDGDKVREIVAQATADGVKCRQLEVSHAFHSPRLDPMLDALERRAAEVAIEKPRIALISNLTGAPFPTGTAPDARYFRRHAREPVRFAAGVEALASLGVTALVEVGPHPVLLGLAGRALPAAKWASVATLRRSRDDRQEIRAALASLYTRGVAVAWDAVYQPGSGRRISLPTYPFQRERHWIETPRDLPRQAVTGHPLLGERRELASAPGTYVWETTVGLDSHPWLTDHRVQGTAIVPATAYIEMALAAGREMLEKGSLVVLQIENLKPLLLGDGDRRTLQATLVTNSSGPSTFQVHSRGSGGAWVGHVTARVAISPDAPADGPAALEASRARCTTRLDGAAFYEALARKGNEWGPCFQGIKELWLGEGEAVGRVEVAAELAGQTALYQFHPAVSDSCGHALVATVPFDGRDGATSGAFVGGGVHEIRFHRSPVGDTLWAHALLRPRNAGEERVVIGDVRVYDEAGHLVSETLGARLWYLDDKTQGAMLGAPDDWYYELAFRAEPLGAKGERAAAPGPWIVFEDRRGIGGAIATRRAASGGRTVRVVAGDRFSLDGDRATVRPADASDIARLLDAIPDAAAVLHLSSVDASADEAQAAGPDSVLALLRAMLGRDGGRRSRLWLVTSDTQRVVASDKVGAPFGAALWGMGRSISAEHAELWGGLVDVAPDARDDALAESLIREVETGARDDQIGLRDGQRYAAHLEHRKPRGPRSEYHPRSDGTYLVTGGLGGIGLEMARWLVEKGARHLLLIGRTALPPREKWNDEGLDPKVARRLSAISALESLGARVETAPIDIATQGALEACLEARQRRGEPKVCGVIHAAGILRFRALGAEDAAEMHAGLGAKIDGTWRLHRVLEREALDCFILCSSSSALLRSPLLGVYAAGNAFLDALAHYRRGKGLTALSINWGTWGEVGMAAEAGREKGSMLTGMSVMSTASALSALTVLVETGSVNAAVMPVDWKALGRAYPAFAADPVVAGLVGDAGAAEQRSTGSRAAALAIRAAAPGERAELLTEYLRGEAARTLGMAPGELDVAAPLSTFGFDSLMAVQLKNQIEADLKAVVPMIRFLDGPSLSQLVPSVVKAMAQTSDEAPLPEVAPADAWEEGSL